MRVRIRFTLHLSNGRLFHVHKRLASTDFQLKMTMNIVNWTSECDLQNIDQTCRYKFDWGWLDEALPDNGGNSPPVRLGDFIRKVDAAGMTCMQINWEGNARKWGFFLVQNVNFCSASGSLNSLPPAFKIVLGGGQAPPPSPPPPSPPSKVFHCSPSDVPECYFTVKPLVVQPLLWEQVTL